MRFVRAAQLETETRSRGGSAAATQAAAVGKAAVSGIDWRSKAVMVSGIGAPMAEAYQDAQSRNRAKYKVRAWYVPTDLAVLSARHASHCGDFSLCTRK